MVHGMFMCLWPDTRKAAVCSAIHSFVELCSEKVQTSNSEKRMHLGLGSVGKLLVPVCSKYS